GQRERLPGRGGCWRGRGRAARVRDGRDLSDAARRLHLTEGRGEHLLPVWQHVVSTVLRRGRRLLPRGSRPVNPRAPTETTGRWRFVITSPRHVASLAFALVVAAGCAQTAVKAT